MFLVLAFEESKGLRECWEALKLAKWYFGGLHRPIRRLSRHNMKRTELRGFPGRVEALSLKALRRREGDLEGLDDSIIFVTQKLKISKLATYDVKS